MAVSSLPMSAYMMGNGELPQPNGMDRFKAAISSPFSRDLALALLANSRGPNAGSFGQALGVSGLQAQQMGQQRQQQELENKFQQARLQAMMNPVRKPLAVVGPDGKPTYVDEQDAIGQTPYFQNNGLGAYQPGDYTPDSWAQFVMDGQKDPSVLKRYAPPRQESSNPFQTVTRTLADGSTQQGSFDKRTGETNWSGVIVPPGKKAEADSAGTARGKVSGDLEAKGPRAYEQFQIGIKNLSAAMDETSTGPFMGRLPAITSAQQTAEGSEAIMAPILKQLFRESGEGTFTEGDQALLLKMVPNRTDSKDARDAKIGMIDQIVRAKLGIKDGAEAPQATSPAPAASPTKRKRYNPQTGKIE